MIKKHLITCSVMLVLFFISWLAVKSSASNMLDAELLTASQEMKNNTSITEHVIKCFLIISFLIINYILL